MTRLFFLLLSLNSFGLFSQTLTLQENWPQPNGFAWTIEKDTINNLVYVGGTFTSFNTVEPNGTSIDLNTNSVNFQTPNPNGTVFCSISDGNGGWFVGGEFTMVGDSIRKNLFHLDQLGNITDLNININSAIVTMAITGSTLYLGGLFNNINGQLRNRLASIDIPTNTLTSWNPNANAIVRTLSIFNTTLFVGGDFTSIGGQTRNRIAAINTITGINTTWNPNSNGSISTIAISNSIVYVGGSFTTIGGQTRNYLAGLNITTGASNSWNPNVNNGVTDIAMIDTTIYIGGNFTTVGGQTRNYVAAINSNTGIPTSWNPNFEALAGGYGITNIEIGQSSIYLSGTFVSMGGYPKRCINEVNLITGTLVFDINTDSQINTISISGTQMYVGGQFSTIGGSTRNSLVALDGTTGIPTTWNPNVNGIVKDIKLVGSTLYIGGDFTTVNGITRNHIAAIDVVTGLPTAWDPNADFFVNDMAIAGSSLYAVGSFLSMGGQSHSRIAKIDLATGATANWGPTINQEVYTVAVTNSLVYVGGVFSQVNGQSRNAVAAIDLSTGSLTSWNPILSVFGGLNLRIRKVLPLGNNIYIAGSFYMINGAYDAMYVAMFDMNTGIPANWSANMNFSGATLDDGLWDIEYSANNLFFGGAFAEINWQPHHNFAVMNPITSQPWPASINTGNSGTIIDVEVKGTSLFIGGSFLGINGVSRPYFAAYKICYPTTSYTNISTTCNYLWNGNTYTTSGIYYDTLVNFAGCDSIITLDLTIINSTSLTTLTECQSYTWTNGITYATSGNYSQTLINIFGCDSIASLNLTIIQPSFASEIITTCNNYLWPLNGIIYSNSGIFIDTIQTVAGCDSIVSLNLTIIQPSFATEFITTCYSYQWPLNGIIYTNSGIFVDTILTVGGCDSIVSLDLTINLSSSASQTITAYDNYIWGINGLSYSNSGIYSGTIINTNGCDSVITLNLTILPNIPLSVSTFSVPTPVDSCLGILVIDLVGDPEFVIQLNNGNTISNYSGFQVIDSLCPGIQTIFTTDNSGDTLTTFFVIPVDSNYIFNNPYIDSLAIDSIGNTLQDCLIDYSSIDTAYISSLIANGNVVTVIWDIISSNGVTTDTSVYTLNNGNGIYYLQLSVYCLNKIIGNYFTVTEAYYYNESLQLNPVQLLSNIKLYPNPAENILNIESDRTIKEIEFMNLNGQIIKKIDSNSKTSIIELEFLNAGIYFIRVITDKGTSTHKLIKLD